MYNPVIPLLSIDRGDRKVYFHTKTQMFIVLVFVRAKNQIQSKYPLPGEGINKLWYIHTMDTFSNKKEQNIDAWSK